MKFFSNSSDNSVFGLTKPLRGESKVVEWDHDSNEGFGVFGRRSGHRYGVYETAYKALVEHPEAD